MFTISDSVHINAPIERCFLLSTSIELVGETLGMRPIEGKTSGMIQGGDRILWAGWKFGFPQMHETLITQFEPPIFFQDTMARGRFKRFQHDHHLVFIDGRTLLTDKLRFSLPLGAAGRLVAQTIMVPHISRLLRRRMHLLKKVAESEEWRHYLPDQAEPK
jgi:ligand-binding SRPBCC domain-containing protein